MYLSGLFKVSAPNCDCDKFNSPVEPGRIGAKTLLYLGQIKNKLLRVGELQDFSE